MKTLQLSPEFVEKLDNLTEKVDSLKVALEDVIEAKEAFKK